MGRKQVLLILCIVILRGVSSPQSAVAQQIPINGSFEIGSTIPAGWDTPRVGALSDARRTDELATDGYWSLRLVSASDSGRHRWVMAIVEDYGIGERLQLDVSFDALVDLAQGGTASATFQLRNNFRSAPVIDTRTLILPDTGGGFQRFDLGIFDVPALGDYPNDRYGFLMYFRGDADGTIAPQGVEFYVDNVVVNAIPVPEPTALGVAGLWALLGLIARRRGN